jgi:hypothetical protein
MINTWEQVSSAYELPNLILGNGFSRVFWDDFGYTSLLSLYEGKPVGRYLCTRELFEKLDTVNFEEVLRAIYHAYLVSIDNEDATKTLYIDLQKALASAVKGVHPNFSAIPTYDIGGCLSTYKNIFTTNYDLLPYWAILNGHSHEFVDFFFGERKFNASNTEVYSKKIPIHYMHGALHLRSNGILDARKIPITLEGGLKEALKMEFDQEFPLFISEGSSELKLNRIKSNSYLNFCYEELISSNGGLVIFGHDLSEYDEHIVNAIRASGNNVVAVSVFSDLTAGHKNKFIGRIKSLFSDLDKNIVFFDSNTHPFTQFT